MKRAGNDGSMTASAILQRQVIEQIESGELLPGEKLLSERAMAEFYDVSRATVQYALNALARSGYVYRVPGSGTYVREKAGSRMNLEYLNEIGNSGVTALLKNVGARRSNRVLARGRICVPSLANRLELPAEEEVFVLHRVRLANDEAFAVEYSAIPYRLFQDADAIDFTSVSLYDYMDARGHMPVDFNQRFRIMEVNERERYHLQIQRRAPVFHFEFFGFDREGLAVEYTESYVCCDKTELRFNTRVI